MNNIAYLTRIKDEEDLIYYNLKYHYNIGIRNFYITFNNSNEKTISEVKKFFNENADANLFEYHETNTSYMQAEQFNLMSDEAFKHGHKWCIPIDADELLVLKNITLIDFIKKYDKSEYGFINFRWFDHHGSKPDKNFFEEWEYREKNHRQPSKIIYKWSPGCKMGDGHHLLIAKRNKITEIPPEQGYFAHFPNRSLKQIKKKRIRIGEAFIEKYGYESNKPQIQEYKMWEFEGDGYFMRVWAKIHARRENKSNFIHDPIPKELFS